MSQENGIPALDVARQIDHTILKADATQAEVVLICEEAKQYSFATVCVNGCWTARAAKELEGTNIGVTTVVGFPLGAASTSAKVFETGQAIADGATEIDMVMNIGWLKSGRLDSVKYDIASVAEACRGRALLKVILETGLLTEDEKVTACQLSVQAGADFVKTSTGFGHGGATVEDIMLMRQTVGPEIGVKASGGVRDWDTALRMLSAGATRIGASASIAIVTGQKGEGY